MTTLMDTADAYKSAYEALKVAETALAKARQTLEADFALNGVTRHSTSDGSMVSIEVVNNRIFDIDTLRLVAPKAFDKEVADGNITPDAVAKVVTLKPHTRVTVGVAV